MSVNYNIIVITVTRHRCDLLKRAIESVKKQSYPHVKHFIIIDDCQETQRMLETEYDADRAVFWKYFPRNVDDKSGPNRLAFLRNSAIQEIQSDYFSFLDDDNEFLSEHLEKLLYFAISEHCDAVHSYRQILYCDGKPYLETKSPWGRTEAQRLEKYKELVNNGVAVPGSNIWRDKAGVTIDTNVWLLKTELMKKLHIPTDYTFSDWNNIVPEDAKMMKMLLDEGIRICTNGLATVKYYLGGYSNSCGNTKGTERWEY